MMPLTSLPPVATPAAAPTAAAAAVPPRAGAGLDVSVTTPTAAPPAAATALGFPALAAAHRDLAEYLTWNRTQRAELKELERRAGHHGPEYQAAAREFRERNGERLLVLQSNMHQAAFQVELASKVVEQATSGARTVLQTQA